MEQPTEAVRVIVKWVQGQTGSPELVAIEPGESRQELPDRGRHGDDYHESS